MPQPGSAGRARAGAHTARTASLAYSLPSPAMMIVACWLDTTCSLVVVARGDHGHVGEALGGLVHVHVGAVGDGVE